MKKTKSHYHDGKRWGFAIARSQIRSGKLGVAKADKAMQTCSRIARTGTKKLNKNERDAYRGMADGMYEAFRKDEKPKAKKTLKKLRVKKDRYKVDTYVEDGVYNDRYTVHSYAPSYKEALKEADKTEKYEKSLMDHSMYFVDSAISKNHKKFKIKKK
ncbi:MAG: hypothetical protein E7673_02940 [Ruminococcaceae bacterium]|nr:hypothetical protein [Oscillospiraceae bacterium]